MGLNGLFVLAIFTVVCLNVLFFPIFHQKRKKAFLVSDIKLQCI